MLQGMPAQGGSPRQGAARREATTTACRSQQKAEMCGSKEYLDSRGVSSIQSPASAALLPWHPPLMAGHGLSPNEVKLI